MNKVFLLTVGVGLSALIGCGSSGSPRDTTTVDVTATVTGPDGKPLSKTMVVVLQPTGDTLPAKLEAKTDGQFSGKATPGKYVFFVKLAKSDDPPKGIPAKYTEPTETHTVDVAAGRPLDIKLAN